MKIVAIISVLVLAALNALTLAPPLAAYQLPLMAASLAVSVLVLVAVLLAPAERTAVAPQRVDVAVPPPVAANQADARMFTGSASVTCFSTVPPPKASLPPSRYRGCRWPRRARRRPGTRD